MTHSGVRAGCELLANKLADLHDLKASLFGHVHEAKGLVERNGVVFSNAACQVHDMTL
jgi:Icc-related predicted phosphoesterase